MRETVSMESIAPVVWAAARILLVALLGYSAFLFFLQRSVVFPGARQPPPPAGYTPPPGVTPLWLPTSFGRVESWLIDGAGEGPRPAVLFAHGNGEFIDGWVEGMTDLARAGISVLLVEFPGYGLSDGKPSRKTVRETFRAAFDALAAREDVDPERIVAWGRSLGGGAAGDLALDRPVSALILQSTFSSTARMAWEAFRAPGFLVRDRWNNRTAVEAFEGPILLLHGRSDEVIPFPHAETLAGAREGLSVTELRCGHNDCSSEWYRIKELVLGFLAENGVL